MRISLAYKYVFYAFGLRLMVEIFISLSFSFSCSFSFFFHSVHFSLCEFFFFFAEVFSHHFTRYWIGAYTKQKINPLKLKHILFRMTFASNAIQEIDIHLFIHTIRMIRMIFEYGNFTLCVPTQENENKHFIFWNNLWKKK